MDWIRFKLPKQAELYPNHSRGKFSIYRALQWPRASDAHGHSKRNNYKFRNGYDKYLLAIALSCSQLAPAMAQTDVGGVSATANPIANSSGSVTNQAIQVLQGPYITSQYGDGISCQGPTMNLTPYITRTGSWQDPYEAIYQDPVYNNVDANDDGVPDNPGQILYYVPTRTGQKSSQNVNLGLSATFSFSLDKEQERLCKQAAKLHNSYRAQLTANKRLDFEIARLKNCGELMKAGIMFHPKSPYAAVCADVMLVNPPGVVANHNHTITPKTEGTSSSSLPLEVSPTASSDSEDLSSSDNRSQDSPDEKVSWGFFRGWRLPWSEPSLSQDEKPSAADQLGVWQVGHSLQPQSQSQQ